MAAMRVLGRPVGLLRAGRRWNTGRIEGLGAGAVAAVGDDVLTAQRRYETVRLERDDEKPVVDTYQVARDLRDSGLTDRQSEAVMRALDKALRQTLAEVERSFLSRTSYGGDLQRQWQELEQMRRHILVLEKTEVFTIRNELERKKTELQNQRLLQDKEMGRLENGMKLDHSLLKAYLHGELQKTMEKVDTTLSNELTRVEHHFAAEVKKQIAEVKLDAYKSLVALIVGFGTLVMTYLRFFPSTPERPAPAPAPPARSSERQPASVQTSPLDALPPHSTNVPYQLPDPGKPLR